MRYWYKQKHMITAAFALGITLVGLTSCFRPSIRSIRSSAWSLMPFDLYEHQAVAGWDFIDVSGVGNRSGKIHYVIYTTYPGATPSAAAIKAASAGGAILAAGEIEMSSAHNNFVVTETAGIAANTNYHVFIAAEDSNGSLLADSKVKYVPLTTAVRHPFVTYTSPVATADSGAVPTDVGYFIYKPREYYRNPNKKLPILYFFHGAGENQAVNGVPDSTRLDNQGLPLYISNMTYDETLPFIVVSPQLWFNRFWRDPAEQSFMVEFINRIDTLEGSRINRDRVYFTGLSMGGCGILGYLTTGTNSNAVAASFMGAGWYNSEWTAAPATPCINTPVWGINGGADPFGGGTARLNMQHTIDNRFNTFCGGTLNRYTSIPAGGHSSGWTNAYLNTHGDSNTGGDAAVYTNTFQWLLSFMKSYESTAISAAGAEDRIKLTVNAVRTGTFSYAIYSSDQGSLSNAQVISVAASSPSGSLTKAGQKNLASTDLNQNYAVRLGELPPGTYTVYMVYVDVNSTQTASKLNITI